MDRNPAVNPARTSSTAAASARFILLPVGSFGDVHPFVGLGRALHRRGHRVMVVVNDHFEPLVTAAGLEFIPLGSAEEYRRVVDNPDLWKPSRGSETVIKMIVKYGLRQMHQTVMQMLEDRTIPTVVAGGSLAFGGRMARDQVDVPYATIHLQPSVFRTVYETSHYAINFVPSWTPTWWKRLAWGLMRYTTWYHLTRPVNKFRAELGLPRVREVIMDWWDSPDRVIGLFPDWFGTPQPDWPPQTRLTGFPLFDEADMQDDDPLLDGFLNDCQTIGSRPIVFTPGSANAHGRRFFDAAVDACVRLNRPGVLLSRYPENLPQTLPDLVRHFDYVPLSRILPRAAALVYHGGIGTCAQACAAGVPQLVMPLAHDQFDTADRVRRLGLGGHISVKRFTGENAAAALAPILDNPDVARACREVAQKFVGADAVARACDLLEEMIPR